MKILCFLFCLLRITQNVTTIIEKGFNLEFELPSAKIKFVSSSFVITLWRVSSVEGEPEILRPCAYNLTLRTCSDFTFPITLEIPKIRSIKEKYDNEYEKETVYNIDGVEGYICMKPEVNPLFCKRLGETLIYSRVITNIMNEHFRFYGAHIQENTKIYFHEIADDEMYWVTEEKVIETVNVLDLKEQNTQNCLYYWEETTSIELIALCYKEYIYNPDSELGSFRIVTDSSNIKNAIIETSGIYVVICFGDFMTQYKYDPYIDDVLPTFQKQEPLTPEYQKCNMKIRNESIFFITDNGILEHSLNNFSEKTLIEFPEEVDPNLVSLQTLESTGALFMFQKESNKIFTFFENIIEIPDEEEEENQENEEENKTPNKKLCEKGCMYCENAENICLECKVTYFMNENNKCVKSEILAFIINIVNVLRPPNLQSAFFTFVNFDLYNLHSSPYEGFFYECITFANSVEESVWEMLPFETVKNWLEQPFDVSSYEPYTNDKFIDFKGKDSLFIQNTKSYFIVFVPAVIVLFVLVRFAVLKIDFLRKIQFFKMFTFWLFLLFMTVMQNCQYLLLYGATHFLNVFTFDFETKFIGFVTIHAIFCIIFLLVSLMPMLLYQYRRKCELFLGNLRFSNLSLLFMSIQFVAKPFCESILHTLLFYSPATQKTLLSIFGCLFICVFMFLEAKYALSQSKTIFWIQIFQDFVTVILNVLLLFRYDFKNDFHTQNLYNFCIEKTTYLLIGLLLFEILDALYDLSKSIYLFVLKLINRYICRKDNYFAKESKTKKVTKKILYFKEITKKERKRFESINLY